MLTGGCFCGHVRYAIRAAPFNSTLCHCVDCRRISGAPVVAWFSVTPADLVMSSGAPCSFASSPGVTRSFCRECGTPLFYQRDDLPGEIDITTASLDDPASIPPQDHTYARQRIVWMDTAMPTYPGARPNTES